MKAGAIFRAWVWAEVLFVGYLFLRKEPVLTDEQSAQLKDLEDRLKEKIDAPAQNP